MLTFIPRLVAGILIAIGLFLIIWGKVTLRPGRRKVMDSQGHMRNSFSLRATRGLGLIFILGGGAHHIGCVPPVRRRFNLLTYFGGSNPHVSSSGFQAVQALRISDRKSTRLNSSH